jgi:hypothetical protein
VPIATWVNIAMISSRSANRQKGGTTPDGAAPAFLILSSHAGRVKVGCAD